MRAGLRAAISKCLMRNTARARHGRPIPLKTHTHLKTLSRCPLQNCRDLRTRALDDHASNDASVRHHFAPVETGLALGGQRCACWEPAASHHRGPATRAAAGSPPCCECVAVRTPRAPADRKARRRPCLHGNWSRKRTRRRRLHRIRTTRRCHCCCCSLPRRPVRTLRSRRFACLLHHHGISLIYH